MAFHPSAYTEFRYRDCLWRDDKYEARFHYELVGPGVDTMRFTETLQFTPATTSRVDHDRLQGILVLLGAVLGLSYYKAAAPPTYVIDTPGLTEQAIDYLRLVITEGMAEFAYRNGFDGPLAPDITLSQAAASAWPVENWRELDGDPLVPIGGGKDSIVTVEALYRQRLHPVQFAVNANPVIHRVARASGHPLITAKRTIDPLVIQLNDEGALNGHVPVTAMNSLIALAQSRILDMGPVVMSNEGSASLPTLVVEGWAINHQWSKSEAAEAALQAVIGPQAGLQPQHYFSLLRPFSELHIAGYFATVPRYHQVATSCNRAFRMGVGDVGWCGECDKCRFVFLILAAYLSPSALRQIFGRDVLNEPEQIPGFDELLGLARHKPFECVGSEAESMVALSFAARRSDWATHQVVSHFERTIPGLADRHPELEQQVLVAAASPTPLPGPYQDAQDGIR